MRMRQPTAGLIVAGGMAALVVAVLGVIWKAPVPPSVAGAGLRSSEPIESPMTAEAGEVRLDLARFEPMPILAAPTLPVVAEAEAPLQPLEPPLVIASREIASGETLDAILAEAGLAAPYRAEIALALGAEYDLRRLRPGDRVTTSVTADGAPRHVTLEVDDGVRIETDFLGRPATRVVAPEPQVVTLAGEVRIESSIFSTLDDAGLPARFAVDLAQILGGTVDFRRDLSGGEILRLMWRETRVEGRAIGQPEIAFAALDLGDALYEVVWAEGGNGRTTIYLDGEVLRVFAQPVDGARLTSVFGRRRHPVYGNVRMHTGVDFAAAHGTPVHSTAPGRIAFIGWRGGYGRVVEIANGAETLTRYAHLSVVPEDLAEGQLVSAGDTVGLVGATGTTTGPNLHYEVLVDGRPTDPLADGYLARTAEDELQQDAALALLGVARATFEENFRPAAWQRG